MNSPFRWGWLTNRRFVRTASALLGLLVLGVVLYNATLVDRVPPSFAISLSKVTPGSLALTLTDIDVVFTEKVQHDTAENAFSLKEASGASVPGSFAWQATKMIFTPSEKLPLKTQFVATVGPGVKDVVGNTETETKTLAFTTVDAPVVTTVVPAKGADHVQIDSKILITFDRFMDPNSVLRAIQLSPPVDVDESWSGTILTITPKKALQFATEYTLNIDSTAVDTDGTPLPAYRTTFKTAGQGLTAVSTIPAPGVAGVSVRTQIAVAFDGPIDPNSINSPFQITPSVSGDVRAIDVPNDSKPSSQAGTPNLHVLSFTPSQALAPHTTYTVVLKAGIRRTDGDAAGGQTWSFTTGEAPTTVQNQIVFLSDRAGISNVWVMNPDGTNPRELTTELVPVVGFDVTADGSRLVYTVGGQVKRMTIASGDITTMTSGGRYEYAPVFTPDGTAVILGRRDQNGADLGYWQISLSGGEQQIVPVGAPGIGSVTLTGDGLTEDVGRSSWAGRAAFSQDGKTMLLVRGDNALELVDLTGATPARKLDLSGQGAPVYVRSSDEFYAVAKGPADSTSGYWRITKTGTEQRIGDAVGDMAATPDGKIAALVISGDGATHLRLITLGSDGSINLASDTTWSERSPSFSPDNKTIVFARVFADATTKSAGIWVVKADGTGLSSLATDGITPRWVP